MSLSTFLDMVRGLIRQELSDQKYRERWPARVVAQRSDGTLDLVPDHDAIPGLTEVPLRLGIPGATVKVPAGTRVNVAFERYGSHWRPIAELWETGSSAGEAPIEITLPATSKIRLGPSAHRRVARIDDTTNNGVWSFSSSTPTTIEIALAIPGQPPQVVVLTLGAGPATAPIFSMGVIDSGSGVVEAT